jgi:hypothetical protein
MPIKVTIFFTEDMQHVTVKEVVSGEIHIDDETVAKDHKRELIIDDSEGIGRVKISGKKVLADGTEVPYRARPDLRSDEEYRFPPAMTALAEIRNFPSLDALVTEIKSRL